MKEGHSDTSVRHWETRPEESWKDYKFRQPFERGLSRLKDEILGRTNFDPAVLWQWGTMQSVAIIEILKNIEMVFGREGQKVVQESLYKVGYSVGRQITDKTVIPQSMSDAEWISFYATIINRIAYASLESPEIIDDNKVCFHIDWCPHQDHYEAFDCRVQRYFVQGMIDAGADFSREQGREAVWDVAFRTTIPSGSQTCFFEIFRGDPQTSRAWSEYTCLMEDKALERAARKRVSGKD